MVEDLKAEENRDNESGAISTGLEDFIDFLEKDRFTPLTAFILLVIVGIIRSVSESWIYDYPHFSLYLLLQHTAFNFPVLIMGSLILSIVSKVPLRKTYNTILPVFSIVIVPPFIDYFIFGYAGSEDAHLYTYYEAETSFIHKIADLYPPNMLLAGEISPGLKLMGLSIMILSCLYIAVKVKIWKSIKLIGERKLIPVLKKIGAISVGVFGIWVVIWFIVMVVPESLSLGRKIFEYFNSLPFNRYYLFIMNHGYTPADVFTGEGALAANMALQQRTLYFTMIFSILSFGFMILSMGLKHRSVLKKIFSSLKLTVILPTTVSALLGSAVLHIADPDFTEGWALDPSYLLHFPYIFYIGAMGFLLGCFGCFVLDFYKEGGILSKSASKNMAIISFLAGGSYAFLMGPFRISSIFILATFLLFLSFWGKNRSFDPLSNFTFSTSCVIIYLLGVYSPAFWKTKTTTEDPGGIGRLVTLDISRTPELTAGVVALGIIIFLFILNSNHMRYLLEEELLSKWLDSSHLVLPIILMALAFVPAFMFNDIDHLIACGSLGFASVILTDEDLAFVPMGTSSFILVYMLLSVWELIPNI